VLGRDRRLAEWERDGSTGRGVVGYAFPVERLHVSWVGPLIV
jgi:hypothetical protein